MANQNCWYLGCDAAEDALHTVVAGAVVVVVVAVAVAVVAGHCGFGRVRGSGYCWPAGVAQRAEQRIR